MAYNYNDTHQKIIESARELFLEKGYERTNLRQICTASGVTNGAFYRHFKSKEELFSFLVEPCIKKFNKIYFETEDECFNALTKDGILSAMQISAESVISLIDCIYDEFKCFRLLLLSSNGTKYEMFLEEIVSREVKESIKFFDEVVRQNVDITIPNEKIIHMLSHCYFNTIFECVVHKYEKKEILNEVKTLVDFFNAGWKKILGV